MSKFNKFDEYSQQKWGHFLEGMNESIDPNDYLICTYYLSLGQRLDPTYMGKVIVKEQTIGSYMPITSDPKEVIKKFAGKVLGIYETPPYEISIPDNVTERHYIMQIAYPIEGISPQFPLLLTTIAGNISMGGKIKLLDVNFPPNYLKHFKGPKFGIEGLRNLLDIPDRPFLTNINHSYSIKEGASQFYQAAIGGADFIKDNENLAGNVKYLPLEERVTKYLEQSDLAEEQTGEKTIYLVNITDEPTQIMNNAQTAIDHGANGLMVNYLTVGLPVVRNLAEDPSIKVPLLGHMDFAGVYYESEWSGISSYLIMGKFARMCGLDILIYPSFYGKAPFLKDKYLGCAKALRYPFWEVKPVVPMPAGGVTPGIVLKMMKDLGSDIMIGAGSSIHLHPNGTQAGTKAFRQVIEIGMAHLEEAVEDLEDFLEEHESEYPELVTALDSWGDSSLKYETSQH
jgi:2,3-diketo-5-methylthiopentyl-1-phosphate enolase